MDKRLPSPYVIMKRSRRILDFDENGHPVHPVGFQTRSKKGKGELWKWGSNFSCDIMVVSGDMILLVQKPSGMWCLPGGFKNNKESDIDCALRECVEEAFDNNSDVLRMLKEHISQVSQIYDNMNNYDARNTKYAWLESKIFLIQIPIDTFTKLKPTTHGGDDVIAATWYSKKNIPDNVFPLHLIMIHKHFIQK